MRNGGSAVSGKKAWYSRIMEDFSCGSAATLFRRREAVDIAAVIWLEVNQPMEEQGHRRSDILPIKFVSAADYKSPLQPENSPLATIRHNFYLSGV